MDQLDLLRVVENVLQIIPIQSLHDDDEVVLFLGDL